VAIGKAGGEGCRPFGCTGNSVSISVSRMADVGGTIFLDPIK